MAKRSTTSSIEGVKAKLRQIVLAVEPGALLGSEEALIAAVGVSRSTLRQVARLLEREGLLRVRRGINGGYYGSRPDEGTIQATVSAYLEALDVSYEDVAALASVLWVEVMRRAAGSKIEAARTLAEKYRRRVLDMNSDATFEAVVALEKEIREAIFELVKSRYIQLIFHINVAFSRDRFSAADIRGAMEHREFVRAWREAKLLELSAIDKGDVELGMMAARHSRNVWSRGF